MPKSQTQPAVCTTELKNLPITRMGRHCAFTKGLGAEGQRKQGIISSQNLTQVQGAY